jgi:hypothetical protein
VLCVPAKEQTYPAELEHGTFVVEVGPIQAEINKEQLAIQLLEAMKGMHRVQVINAIVENTLHPAITINWGAVQ